MFNEKLKTMKTLTTSEINNAVRTIETIDAPNYRTYYIDELKSGKIGVSLDEYPLKKFDNIEQAKAFINERANNN